MEFTSSSKVDLWNFKRNLACSKVRLDQDISNEARIISKELAPYLKDVNKGGRHKDPPKKDILIVNRGAFDFSYLGENITLESKSR
jgi:hypothetical protein